VTAPHEIIIAYRGTDPGLFSGKTNAEKLDHALTTVQDAVADATMVRDAVNLQKRAADAFTKAMIDKAASKGIGMDRIFVTGHSLGGALAEIEAAKYGLTGSTYNAFGAAGLLDGPPKPGCHLTNYRMAGDVVSAASRQVGEVVTLASPDGVHGLSRHPEKLLASGRLQEALQRHADPVPTSSPSSINPWQCRRSA
jgi:putative lipase involved disintegration of autophagic bodies